MKKTRVIPSECPHCGRVNDSASSFDNKTPKIGDASVCLRCGGVSIYSLGFVLRKPFPHEMEVLDRHEGVQRLRRSIKHLGVK